MASAILTVWKLEDHTVPDRRAAGALRELASRGALGSSLSVAWADALPDYWTYLQAYRPIAQHLAVGYRDLDRALWTWHKARMPDGQPER